MLGSYDNFPENIHLKENYTAQLSTRRLQQRLIKVLQETNRRTFSFSEIAHPFTPECTTIFEIGLAESKSFSYIDDEETKKALSALKKRNFRLIDLFCAVRYYKGNGEKKKPLKFDYYLVRTVFGENAMEIQVFHERGPRYISPEDIVTFLVNRINEASARKILKKIEPFQNSID
jgi:hypothetical protein